MKDVFSALVRVVGMFVVISLLCYGLVVSYWMLYPYNVIDVDHITIQNKDKVVKQGGVLIYEIQYTKYLDIVGTVHRKLVNTYTITYSDAVGMSPVGSATTNTHLPVPAYATPGKYHLLWRVTHKVNPMREIVETVFSDEFEIVAGDNTVSKKDPDPESPCTMVETPKSKNSRQTSHFWGETILISFSSKGHVSLQGENYE